MAESPQRRRYDTTTFEQHMRAIYRAYREPTEPERYRARRIVCGCATDAADARLLLNMLDLLPEAVA